MKACGAALGMAAAVGIGALCLAGDEPRGFPHRLVVDLADGSRLIGTTTVESFPARHEVGAIQVKLRSILSVTTPPDGSKSVVSLRNGDRLQVDWDMQSLSVQTMLGASEIPVSSIRGMLVENFTLSGEPGAWPVLRTYDYTDHDVTERSYTDKTFLVDGTTPKDGNTNNILREVVYGLDGKLRQVRYPGGLQYGLRDGAWTRTEMGSYLDLPNFQRSPTLGRDDKATLEPITKITEGDMTLYRLPLSSALDAAYPAGTKVCQHMSGGTYQYAAAANAVTPDHWTKYEGVVRGETTASSHDQQFRRGTKYVRIMILPHFGQKGDYRLRFDGLSFGDAIKNENLIANHDSCAGWEENLKAAAIKGDGVGDDACAEMGDGICWTSTDYIPVDTMKAYRLSGWFKSCGSAGLDVIYYGVVCYDSRKQIIFPDNVIRVDGTLTELAVAAKPGDTVLHLKDASQWRSDVWHLSAAFNVDSTPENTRIKRSTGAYAPDTNQWTPDGGEAYYFDGAAEPRYVRGKDGAWVNNLRSKEKGTYHPIADRWTVQSPKDQS
jgi:hypothetical protein